MREKSFREQGGSVGENQHELGKLAPLEDMRLRFRREAELLEDAGDKRQLLLKPRRPCQNLALYKGRRFGF